jgi:hypothetical protein
MSTVTREQLIGMVQSLQETSSKLGTKKSTRLSRLTVRAAQKAAVNAVLAACETHLESCQITQRNLNAVIDPFRLAIATPAAAGETVKHIEK